MWIILIEKNIEIKNKKRTKNERELKQYKHSKYEFGDRENKLPIILIKKQQWRVHAS